MKSKTSSYKLTLLRKDIFRFAPLWGIYLIGGLLVMLSTLNTSVINRAPLDLAKTMSSFAVLNLTDDTFSVRHIDIRLKIPTAHNVPLTLFYKVTYPFEKCR